MAAAVEPASHVRGARGRSAEGAAAPAGTGGSDQGAVCCDQGKAGGPAELAVRPLDGGVRRAVKQRDAQQRPAQVALPQAALHRQGQEGDPAVFQRGDDGNADVIDVDAFDDVIDISDDSDDVIDTTRGHDVVDVTGEDVPSIDITGDDV